MSEVERYPIEVLAARHVCDRSPNGQAALRAIRFGPDGSVVAIARQLAVDLQSRPYASAPTREAVYLDLSCARRLTRRGEVGVTAPEHREVLKLDRSAGLCESPLGYAPVSAIDWELPDFDTLKPQGTPRAVVTLSPSLLRQMLAVCEELDPGSQAGIELEIRDPETPVVARTYGCALKATFLLAPMRD